MVSRHDTTDAQARHGEPWRAEMARQHGLEPRSGGTMADLPVTMLPSCPDATLGAADKSIYA